MNSALGVRRVRVPFRVPFETAAGTWAARESLIVELRSEAGARGVGEAPIDPAHSTAVLAALIQRLLDGPDDGVPDEFIADHGVHKQCQKQDHENLGKGDEVEFLEVLRHFEMEIARDRLHHHPDDYDDCQQ